MKRNVTAGFLCFLVLILFAGIAAAAEKTLPPPVLDNEWPLERIAQTNNVTPAELLKQLKLPDTAANRAASLRVLNIPQEQAAAAVRKAAVLSAEESSKDWRLILLKFALWWAAAFGGVFLLVRNQVTPSRRKAFLAAAVLIFGVGLGSDPSPMGTIKDAIALFGMERVIFPPRLIAFIVFTLMVLFGNKIICGWGCQFGVLQDWLHQVSPVREKIRVPFVWSQRIRVSVFLLFIAGAFLFSFDLIGAVDPFKIYSPKHLTLVSGAFIAVLLALSFFLYRPWCTFACPFGLSGWFFERFSWYRVRWDRDTCISCGVCKRVCPSRHTLGLLGGEKHPADCYSCGACIHACPVSALKYARK